MTEETRTTDLINSLKTIHTQKELEEYLNNHTTSELNFPDYFNSYLIKHQLLLAKVITRSGLDKNYTYQIMNGTKTHPGRNKIIALCLGANMNLKETQRCLKLSKNASLYPKDTHDAIIITHINNEQWNIPEINIELDNLNLELIG